MKMKDLTTRLLYLLLGGVIVACVMDRTKTPALVKLEPVVVTKIETLPPTPVPTILTTPSKATNTINALNSAILIYGIHRETGGQGGGSAVVVGRSKADESQNIRYYALTAKHVVEAFEQHLDKLDISLVYRSRAGVVDTVSNAFESVYKDANRDVAVISFITTHDDIFVSSLATEEEMGALSVCDEIVLVGSPLGVAPWFHSGEIVELFDYNFHRGAVYEFPYHIATNAMAYPGNSGGGLYLKMTGKVIGIMNSVRLIDDERAHSVNYSLRVDIIRDIIKKQKIEFILENWSH